MADDAVLFRARASAEFANAAAANLDNVRDRATRAAKAWTEMAERAERVQEQRVQRESDTALRVSERTLALAEEAREDDLLDAENEGMPSTAHAAA